MAAPYEERAEEVTFLLEQCGLARYAPAFRNDDVDDSCLGALLVGSSHAARMLVVRPVARAAYRVRSPAMGIACFIFWCAGNYYTSALLRLIFKFAYI